MRDKFQIVCLMLALSVAGNVGLGILLRQANSELSTRSDQPFQPPEVEVVQLTRNQFDWYFRYPGKDGQYGTEDDVTLPK